MKSDPSGDRLCLHLPGEERPPGRRGEDEGGSLLWLNQLAGVPQKFLCHLHTGQHINAVTAVLLSWTDNTPGPGRIQWLMVVSAAAGGRNKNTPRLPRYCQALTEDHCCCCCCCCFVFTGKWMCSVWMYRKSHETTAILWSLDQFSQLWRKKLRGNKTKHEFEKSRKQQDRPMTTTSVQFPLS